MSEEVKDCRNCRWGHYNDHLEIPFCYNPEPCVNFVCWEPKEEEDEQ